jgi:hypothetical protein
VKLWPVSNHPEKCQKEKSSYIYMSNTKRILHWSLLKFLLVFYLVLETLSLLKTVSTSSLETDLNSKTALSLTDRSRYSSNPLLLGGILLDNSVPIFDK